MVSRSENTCVVSIEESVLGVREGDKGDAPTAEYADMIVKRLNTVDKEPSDDAFKALREFNMSFGCTDIPCKDKTAFKGTVTILTKLENKDLRNEDLMSVFIAAHRLLYCKVVYEDASNYKPLINKLLDETLKNKHEGFAV